MSKPKFQAWPAVCAVCNQTGALVLCDDCGTEIHISCGDFHVCEVRCAYCGKIVPDGVPMCDPYCEEKEHGEGYYDSRGRWVKE